MEKEEIELNEDNFDKKTEDGKWIVDFWADWCGPCKAMAEDYAEAAEEMKGKVNFGKVDVEANQDLASKFEVMSIPTLVLIENGKVVYRTVGALAKDEIVSLIEDNF